MPATNENIMSATNVTLTTAPREQMELFLDNMLAKQQGKDAKEALSAMGDEFVPVVIADSLVRIMDGGKFVLKNPSVYFMDIVTGDTVSDTVATSATNAAESADIPYPIVETIMQSIAGAGPASRVVGAYFVAGNNPRFAVAYLTRGASEYVGRHVLPEYKKILREERER